MPPAFVLAFLAILATIELWAIRAADPDFFLPDPFHPFVIGLIATNVLAFLAPWRRLRYALATLVLVLPIVVLVLEWRLRTQDLSVVHDRIAISDDRLLRYTYRPGAEVRGRQPDDPPMTITPDGLWDEPHAVPKPSGVDRIVILGDSVPNDPSIAFRSRFPRRLEALLAEQAPPGRRAEVVNVSCEGYNTLQEERLFEKIGLRYEPALVVVAYVLNDPFLQNGGYRRLGNSFFAFRLLDLLGHAPGESACSLFVPLHTGYNFDLVVRSSFERLRAVAELHHFPVLVAALPIVERFDARDCLSSYDIALGAARDQGFQTLRVVDAFAGEDHRRFFKPGDENDVTHPNAEGHARMAKALAEPVAKLLWSAQPP